MPAIKVHPSIHSVRVHFANGVNPDLNRIETSLYLIFIAILF